jgi:hypothetical protein
MPQRRVIKPKDTIAKAVLFRVGYTDFDWQAAPESFD